MREKLLDLMKSEGLKPSQLAEMLEINPAGVSHILAGRNKPGFDLLQKILRRFPQINPDWLMLDSKIMYRDDAARSSAQFTGSNGGVGNQSSANNSFEVGGFGASDFTSRAANSNAPTLGAGGRGLTAAEIRAMGGKIGNAETSMASNTHNGGFETGRVAESNGRFGAGGAMANNLAGGNPSAIGSTQYVGTGGGNMGSTGGYNTANSGINIGDFGVTGNSGALCGGVAVAKVIVFYSDNTFEWFVPR